MTKCRVGCCGAVCVLALTMLSPDIGAADGSVLARYSFDVASLTQWKLPKALREISGLAMTPDGRLFAHGDERGIVYELDYDHGRLIKAFALGDPTVQEDFEGIAVAGAFVYLVTSHGKIYRAREGADGERVTYESFDTKLWNQCEIEGLAVDARGQDLLLACKQPRTAALDGRSMIFRWSMHEQRLLSAQSIAIDAVEVAKRLDTDGFNPSDLTVAKGDGHLLLLAARQRALAETDASGKIVAALRLPLAEKHRQPEGLAIAPDGRLIIADEGGSGRARLGVYRPTR